MTRLEQARARQAKRRDAQNKLEEALDHVIPTLEMKPSAAFEAILGYAIDGLVAQNTVSRKEHAIWLVSRARSARGIIV